ncbi:MAG: RNA polymerase sigma factor [bacterium]
MAQEVFLDVFQRIGGIYPSAEVFECYLYRSAKNRSVNWLKRKINSRKWLQIFMDAARTWKETINKETRQPFTVKEMTDQLPEEDRRCLELFYIQNYTRAEMADILAVSVSTVCRHLSRVQNALRDLAAKHNLAVIFEGRHGLKLMARNSGSLPE